MNNLEVNKIIIFHIHSNRNSNTNLEHSMADGEWVQGLELNPALCFNSGSYPEHTCMIVYY